MRAVSISQKLAMVYVASVVSAGLVVLMTSPAAQGERPAVKAAAKAGLEILASSQYLPSGGNTIQLRAVLNHSDGSSEDVTKDVVWAVSNSAIGEVSSDGSFKSTEKIGSTIVLASYDNIFAGSTTVVVVKAMNQASLSK